jgi:hypothetical protein
LRGPVTLQGRHLPLALLSRKSEGGPHWKTATKKKAKVNKEKMEVPMMMTFLCHFATT